MIRECWAVVVLCLAFPSISLSATPIDCIARVIYNEARSESFTAMVAVGSVLINRTSDRRWPSDVCRAASQRHQFHYLPTPNRRSYSWILALAAAEASYQWDPSEGANHFYLCRKKPRWASKSTVKIIASLCFVHLKDPR